MRTIKKLLKTNLCKEFEEIALEESTVGGAIKLERERSNTLGKNLKSIKK